MARYRSFVWLTPELLEESDERFAHVQWAKQRQDAEQGFLELHGDFLDTDAALAEFRLALPEVETPAMLHASYLAGSSDIVNQLTASSDIASMLGVPPKPGTGVVVDVTPGGDGAPRTTPPDGTTPSPAPDGGTPKEAEPAAEIAQSINAGLQAIGVSSELWGYLRTEAREEIAEQVVRGLYSERSAYARKVRWTFAPEAELLNEAAENSRSELAADVLKAREGLAPHQIALAAQAVELQKQSVALAEQDVELRKQAVEGQQVVVEMLREFVVQLKKWTSLADSGLRILWVTVVFGIVATIALMVFLWADKISEWVIPTVIFALALFAISPAVLLLRERPLKGLDEAGWPGGQPSSPPQQEGSGGSGGATTAPPANQPASISSTVAYGETNQPKAYGPSGRLRT